MRYIKLGSLCQMGRVVGELSKDFTTEKERVMRKFVVKFKVGGPELWRSAAIERTVVDARNVAMAMCEFYRKQAGSREKMTVTEVYEEG